MGEGTGAASSAILVQSQRNPSLTTCSGTQDSYIFKRYSEEGILVGASCHSGIKRLHLHPFLPSFSSCD